MAFTGNLPSSAICRARPVFFPDDLDLNGKLDIADRAAYDRLTADPMVEVNRMAQMRITEQEIARVTEGLPEGAFKNELTDTLRSHEGKTWKEALDAHQKRSVAK